MNIFVYIGVLCSLVTIIVFFYNEKNLARVTRDLITQMLIIVLCVILTLGFILNMFNREDVFIKPDHIIQDNYKTYVILGDQMKVLQDAKFYLAKPESIMVKQIKGRNLIGMKWNIFDSIIVIEE
jgi:hypothetical protein